MIILTTQNKISVSLEIVINFKIFFPNNDDDKSSEKFLEISRNFSVLTLYYT